MSRRQAALIALPTICLAALPAGAGANDWVLVKVTAGPTGASAVEFGVGIETSADGYEPGALGIGFGSSDPEGLRLARVFSTGGGPTEIRTSKDAGDLRLTIVPRSSFRGIDTTLGVRRMQMLPHETVAVLLFVTGMTMTHVEVAPVTLADVAVDLAVSGGSGSAALPSSEVTGSGHVVTAGSTAAGTAAHGFTAPRGIVGAFSQTWCAACAGTWTAPGAEAVAWVAVARAHVNTELTGPAGTWTYSWSGAGTLTHALTLEHAPSLGAYAPIGDDWTLFDAP